MTRRAFLTRQRDQRRRQTQAAGRYVADLVRQKREALSAGVAAAPVTPSPAGDGPHDVAGLSLDRDER